MTKELLFSKMTTVLKNELVPSTGCTEPSAIAYAAALATNVLGNVPEKVVVGLSGNLIKNTKSVTVPNTGGMKGIKAAVAAGVVSNNPEAKLNVLSSLTASDLEKVEQLLQIIDIDVFHKKTSLLFDIEVTVYCKGENASVHMTHTHQHIEEIFRNGELIYNADEKYEEEDINDDVLSVENIVYYADNVDLSKVERILSDQREYNSLLCDEGLHHEYGVALSHILNESANTMREKAIAYTVAGVDARMAGCNLPAVICCGSGNQGITASMPIAYIGEKLNLSEEKIFRAMIVSNLVAIHIKSGIGCLSAYCGAVVAGAAACAAIAYMCGDSTAVVKDTITNSLAIVSGTVCDGAKASCAAKVQIALEAGFTSLEMARKGVRFHGGDGIIKKEVEDTITAVGRLGKEGMAQTDVEILRIMLDTEKAAG